MIQAVMVAAALVVAGEVQVPPEASYFPSQYYYTEGHAALTRHALEHWTGPSGLVQLWSEGGLPEDAKVALLLGGSAFHDPQLIPLYVEAIGDPSPRLRQAAAFGYRALVADVVLDVSVPPPLDAVDLIRSEMNFVHRALRRGSLTELWLASLLRTFGETYPGWDGVVLERPRDRILIALDAVAWPEDLEAIATAFWLIPDDQRMMLRPLIEGLSLEAFLWLPTGPRQGSGAIHHRQAQERLESWIAARCRLDPEEVIRNRLVALGAGIDDPLGPAGCSVWPRLLFAREQVLQALAARLFYTCGGPATQVSLSVRDGKAFDRAIAMAHQAIR